MRDWRRACPTARNRTGTEATGTCGGVNALPVSYVGRDEWKAVPVVVARSGSAVIDRKEWHQQAAESIRTSTLQQKRVLTTSGRALGSIGDVFLGDAGTVEAFEIASSSVGGLREKRTTLPHAHGVTVGADAVLNRTKTAAEMESKQAQ